MVTKQSLRWKTALQNSYESGYQSVAYGNGKFVAIGKGGYASSPDGITWSHTVFPSTTRLSDFAIVFDGTKFVSNYGVTTDGIDWTITGSYQFRKIVYANGIYVATTGTKKIYTSTDGINWKSITINTENTSALVWDSVAYGNGKFVAVGDCVSTSTDGENWTTVKEMRNQNGREDTVEFNAVKARYVKFQGVERGTGYGYSIWEMQVLTK